MFRLMTDIVSAIVYVVCIISPWQYRTLKRVSNARNIYIAYSLRAIETVLISAPLKRLDLLAHLLGF